MDVYTQTTPEVKDADGNVVQKASTKVNYDGLLLESVHVLAVMKEQRIKSGKRKRSTGSKSARKAHSNLINFLNKRNATEAKGA
jgi:hypothetical protein